MATALLRAAFGFAASHPRGTPRPPTHAPGAPARAGTLTAGAHAAAGSGSARGLGHALRGCCGAGRGAPLGPPEPGGLGNSALGLWGAKCHPNPVLRNPAHINTHKHSHTQTSPGPALAAAGLGRGRSGTSPGSTRGRRSRSAAKRRDVSARRHRPGLTAQRPTVGLPRRGRGRGRGVPVGGALGQEGRREGELGRDVCCAAGTAAGAGRRPGGGCPPRDLPGRGRLAAFLRSRGSLTWWEGSRLRLTLWRLPPRARSL